MEMIAIDIETYSDISLPDCGVHKYVSSDKFGVMLMAYSVDGGDVQLADFMAGEKLPEDVMEGLQDDSVIKTAFNAAFERNCLSKHFGIKLKPESWRCTAVQASMLSLPLSLEGVAEALSLDKKKMSEGKELIRYFCIPCKPTKANGGRTRNMPSDAPEKWELFKSYCIRDVVVEMEIRDKLKNFPIPEKEQRLYCMDQRINDRGIMVDMGLVTYTVLILGDTHTKSIIICDDLLNNAFYVNAIKLFGQQYITSDVADRGCTEELFGYIYIPLRICQ